MAKYTVYWTEVNSKDCVHEVGDDTTDNRRRRMIADSEAEDIRAISAKASSTP